MRNPSDDEVVLSTSITIADLVDVVDHNRWRWFRGLYGFMLANIRPLKRPVPCPGARMFWVVLPDEVAAIKRQLSKRDERWISLKRA